MNHQKTLFPRLTEKELQIIEAGLELAFLAGRWRGQVDLEENMDANFFDAFLGVLYDKKMGMPLHTVANPDLNSRPVKYNLRSDKWREGVKKSAKEYLDSAFEFIKKNMEALWNSKIMIVAKPRDKGTD